MVLLTLSSYNHPKPEDIEIHFETPIELHGNYEIALIGSNVWYSWHNISHRYDNNVLKIFNGRQWTRIIIPDGMYDANGLNNLLTSLLGDPSPVAFKPNEATLRFVLEMDPNYKVDFSEGSLHELLGFEKKIFEHGPVEGRYTPNITRGVDRILIHCSVVHSSYINNQKSDVLYSFVPTTPPGSLLSIQPVFPIYLPINVRSHINTIRMKLTNQLNEPIDLNNEHVTYTLHVRRIK